MTKPEETGTGGDLGFSALLAIIGAIPCIATLYAGSAWGAQPTLGLMLIGSAAYIAISDWRRRHDAR